jgi:hypothetical protein
VADDHNPEDSGTNEGVNRRSFLGRVAGGAALIGAGAVIGTTPAAAQSGITDADPVDGAGNGRGAPNRRRTGLNDDDPVDNAGWGRGAVRATGRRRTGINDADPRDATGYGRGTPNRRRTGLNDSDPVDNSGWGRGGGR